MDISLAFLILTALYCGAGIAWVRMMARRSDEFNRVADHMINNGLTGFSDVFRRWDRLGDDLDISFAHASPLHWWRCWRRKY